MAKDKNIIIEYLNQYFDEADPEEFYRDVFPVGSLAQKGVYEQGKYNAIAVEIVPQGNIQKIKRYTITDDLEMITELKNHDNFIIISPISYVGKTRESKNARYIHGLAIDLDGIEERHHIDYLVYNMTENEHFPKPTYIVSSGTGIHLYYLFEQPVPCFKNIVKQLQAYKTALVRRLWNREVTVLYDRIQLQSLFQGFRMVGSITKHGTRARAFHIGGKVTIEYLNDFVTEKARVTCFTYKSKLTLSKAKVLYPEWYEKRIEQKQPKGKWICKRDLYDWWKHRLENEITEGHRYYGIMCLAVYAKKSGVSYEELSRDAYALIDDMERLTKREDNHFTAHDVAIALEMYNDDYITFPIDTITMLTQIPIEKNKRNYQKQEWHLEDMRSKKQNMKRRSQPFKNPEGRPNKAREVRLWQLEHPSGTKAECCRDTGMSDKTVSKYWKSWSDLVGKMKGKINTEKPIDNITPCIPDCDKQVGKINTEKPIDNITPCIPDLSLKGRPKGSGSMAKIVAEWQQLHEGGSKADCIRDTGLSKPTVYKWWNE